MRAKEMLRQLCESCSEQVHGSRFEAVIRVAAGITLAQRATVTAIGRARPGDQQARHGIKAADRLLSNAKLWREKACWWRALAKRLLRAERRVVVLLDWTQVQGDVWALVATVPFRGRSLPILARSYDKSVVGGREVHVEFLEELRQVLPPHCTPVIVADGGFRSPFFVACQVLRMQYVVRLRNERAILQGEDGKTRSFAEVFATASERAQCLGESRPFASSQHSVSLRVVLGPRPRRARRRLDNYERQRASEPWLLATNLENESAACIVEIYAQRMQIEESFRDAKCPRFGWALRFSKTRQTARMDVLLLLVSLALTCIVLIGAAATHLGLERSLRASSRSQRVLSLFSVGSLVAKSQLLCRIRLPSVWKQLKAQRFAARAFFPPIAPPKSENRSLSLPLPHGLFCADCGWKGADFGWPV